MLTNGSSTKYGTSTYKKKVWKSQTCMILVHNTLLFDWVAKDLEDSKAKAWIIRSKQKSL